MNIERLSRITVEEGKRGGRPCIRGMRTRVTDVLELLGNGASLRIFWKTTRRSNGKIFSLCLNTQLAKRITSCFRRREISGR